MRGIRASVFFAGQQQHGWIAGSVRHVMIRRVGVEGLELIRVPDRSQLGRFESAVRVEFGPQHVEAAPARDRGFHQPRMLREQGAHQQAAVARAVDRQFRRFRVIGANEKFRAGGKVVECVLFVRQPACLAPLLAVSAAAAHARHGKQTALIQPDAAREIEAGRGTRAEAAVAGQQRGIIAVQARSFFPDDAQRYWRAILRGRGDAHGLDIREGDRRGLMERFDFGPFLILIRVVAPPRGRVGVGLRTVHRFIALGDQKLLHGGERLIIRNSNRFAEKIDERHLGPAALQKHHPQSARAGLETLDDVGSFGGDGRRVFQIQLGQRQTLDFAFRSVPRREEIQGVVLRPFDV